MFELHINFRAIATTIFGFIFLDLPSGRHSTLACLSSVTFFAHLVKIINGENVTEQQRSRETAEHLIDDVVSMTNRSKTYFDFLEDPFAD